MLKGFNNTIKKRTFISSELFIIGYDDCVILKCELNRSQHQQNLVDFIIVVRAREIIASSCPLIILSLIY